MRGTDLEAKVRWTLGAYRRWRLGLESWKIQFRSVKESEKTRGSSGGNHKKGKLLKKKR